MSMRKKAHGSLLINFLLLAVCIGILAGVSVPSFKQHNKRQQFREILELADATTGTVEKCLGLERDPSKCDTTDDLIRYGFSPVSIELSELVDKMTFELKDESFIVTFSPPESNTRAPFLNATHNYIRVAKIIDRNGRPVIETWSTSPHSGCLQNGYCE